MIFCIFLVRQYLQKTILTMASPGTPSLPNLPSQQNPPNYLPRSISIREATTTDGFKILSNKHYTYHIQKGTLNDAIKNGYIDIHDAMIARNMKDRHIVREILANKQRALNVPYEINEHETIDSAKSADDANEVKGADKDAGDVCKSEDAGSSKGDSSKGEDNQ